MMLSDLQTVSRELVDPATLYGAAFYALVCGLLAWLAGRVVKLAVHRMLDGHAPTADQTAVRFLADLAGLAIYIVAGISYAHLIPALNRLGTVWLTSVGVVSVVLGLAAQNTLGNLIAGISLLLYRPFQLGDRLQIMAPTGLESGIVESLSLGYTTVRTDDNRTIVIPNSVMASQTCVRISGAVYRADCAITVQIGYSADIDRARDVLVKLATQHAKTAEVPSCVVNGFTEAGVAMTLTVSCADMESAAHMKSDLLAATKKQFAADGIELAHAVSNVTVKGIRK
jgi:small conductance mechanosensitive channel